MNSGRVKEVLFEIGSGAAALVGAAALAGCDGHAKAERLVTLTVTTGENIPTVPVNSRGPDVMLKNSRHREIVQFSSGSPTFGDYRHSGNEGLRLPQGAIVETDCLIVDPEEASDSTHGKWYHLIGPKAVRGLFTPSNNFENGVDNPNAGPAADPKVPLCP